MAADPVNTATGALMEQFGDLYVSGVGQSINLARTYNSLDTASGPFGPGWSYAYGASLVANASGEFVFTDGSGTRTRFGALVGGGYAPIDPAVSATLSDGPDGTHVMRNLSGNTMTFDQPGNLIAAADERGQGLTFAYTAGALTTVTDALGQTLTFGWDGTGADSRIVSATTSDGRAVGYAYTDTAGAKRLTGVTAVDGPPRRTRTRPRVAWRASPTRWDTSAHATRTTRQGASRASVTRPARRPRSRGTRRLRPRPSPTQRARSAQTSTRTSTSSSRSTEMGRSSSSSMTATTTRQRTVDAANQLYRSEYDDRDRLVLRVAPAPLYYAESWTYDDADRVTSHTDADGYMSPRTRTTMRGS